MVRRHAPLEALEPLVEAEHAEIVVTEGFHPALGHLADGGALGGVGQADTVADDLVHRVVAGGAAEDEDDGRQHLAPAEFLDHLGAPWGAVRQARPPPPLPVRRASLQRPPYRLVDAEPLAARLPVVVQEGAQHRLVILPTVDGEVVAEDDGALPLDDHRRVPTHRPQPPTELVGVVHGGGEAHEAHLGRAEDEDLLPDPAAIGVLNEVDLVEHDRVQALEEIGAGQEHVAQHLGGHHDDRRPGAERGVPGQQPDVLLAVGRHQLRVLLVRQGLERRGVEGLALRRQGPVDGVRRHQRLARPGRRGHQDRVSGVEGVEGLVLEVVQGERQVGLELRRPGRGLDRPRGRGQRPSSFPIPMERK